MTVSSNTTNTYTYDGATEITGTTFLKSGSTQTSGTHTYDAANELQSILETQGATTVRNLSFSYDKRGNRTLQSDKLNGVNSLTYSYNQANELTLYNSKWQYKYNGDGLRVSKYNTQGGPPPPMPGNGTPTPAPKLLPGGSTSQSGQNQPAITVPISYT